MPMLEISNIKFKTQDSARKFIRELLKDLGKGKRICRGESNYKFLTGLLSRHPDHCAVEPDAFRIQENYTGGLELAFEIGGIGQAFSYNTCIRAQRRGNDLDMAMRRAALSDVLNARNASTDGICTLCGLEILAAHKTHVDHEIPFSDLKKEFLSQWSGKIPSQFYTDPERGGFIAFHEDDVDFETSWMEFHNKKARLRVVHDICNLKRKRN